MKKLYRLFIAASVFASSAFLNNITVIAEESTNIIQLESGCKNGDVQNCADLSLLHFNAKNYTLAIELSDKACKAENMKGCNVRALIYQQNRQIDLAEELFEKSCDNKNMAGCFNLGLLKFNGNKLGKSKDLFDVSCKSGLLFACHYLGLTEKRLENKVVAKNLFTKNCEQKIYASCAELGAIFDEAGDKVEAKKYFKLSCDNYDEIGCTYFDKLVNERARLFDGSCKMNDYSACNSFADLLAESLQAKYKYPEIFQAYDKACKGGIKNACDKIRPLLTQICIEDFKNKNNDCYKDGLERRVGNTVYIEKNLVETHECKNKVNEIQTTCPVVATYEARVGNIVEAERIFKLGCSSKSGMTGYDSCRGLACSAHIKLEQGNEKDAASVFKYLCGLRGVNDGYGYQCKEFLKRKNISTKVPKEFFEISKSEASRCKKDLFDFLPVNYY